MSMNKTESRLHRENQGGGRVQGGSVCVRNKNKLKQKKKNQQNTR